MYQMFVKTPTGGRVYLGIVRTSAEAESARTSLSTYGHNAGYEPIEITVGATYLYRKGNLKLRLFLGYDPTDEEQHRRWKIHCAESPFPVQCGTWFIGLPWEKMHEHLKREGFELSYMTKGNKAYHLVSKQVLTAQVIASHEVMWEDLVEIILEEEKSSVGHFSFNKSVECFWRTGDGFAVYFCPINESTSLYNLYRTERVWEEV